MGEKLSVVQSVPNLATLRALGDRDALTLAGITNPADYQLIISNGTTRTVGAIAAGDLDLGTDPAFTDTDFIIENAQYIYRSAASVDSLEPFVVVPANNVGRWIMVKDAIAYQTVVPANPPILPNVTYYAELTSPDRLVKWRSPDNLQATPVLADWVPDYEPVEVDLASAATLTGFDADFLGQKVKSLSTSAYQPGKVFEALDQAGIWQADLEENNGYIQGDDVTASFTVDGSIGGFQRNATGSVIITLPENIPEIRFRIVVFDALAGSSISLQLDAAGGAIVNGAASIPGIANRIVEIYNKGNAWYAV